MFVLLLRRYKSNIISINTTKLKIKSSNKFQIIKNLLF